MHTPGVFSGHEIRGKDLMLELVLFWYDIRQRMRVPRSNQIFSITYLNKLIILISSYF
uniref:Uncharacterized protein n=1 Tax=Candidatus Methanogaster sp. ANME-2c ERB4 TaxID=2759911 RepID=A0A7G9YGZ2_9EURY|nr:hypothetical protein BDMKHGCF_00019 [Methanosarcinales archaeon ANME-2c ERB4]